MRPQFMGTVLEVGTRVRSIAVGDRVVASFDIGCGRCFQCKQAGPQALAACALMCRSLTALWAVIANIAHWVSSSDCSCGHSLKAHVCCPGAGAAQTSIVGLVSWILHSSMRTQACNILAQSWTACGRTADRHKIRRRDVARKSLTGCMLSLCGIIFAAVAVTSRRLVVCRPGSHTWAADLNIQTLLTTNQRKGSFTSALNVKDIVPRPSAAAHVCLRYLGGAQGAFSCCEATNPSMQMKELYGHQISGMFGALPTRTLPRQARAIYQCGRVWSLLMHFPV